METSDQYSVVLKGDKVVAVFDPAHKAEAEIYAQAKDDSWAMGGGPLELQEAPLNPHVDIIAAGLHAYAADISDRHVYVKEVEYPNQLWASSNDDRIYAHNIGEAYQIALTQAAKAA